MSEQSNPPGLRPVSRRVHAPAEAVWAVVSDGWLYANWVVGTSRVRAVDSTWPDAGSRIHHSFGVWPAVIDDETVSLQVVPGRTAAPAGPGVADGRSPGRARHRRGAGRVVHGHDRRGRRDRTRAAGPPSGATGRRSRSATPRRCAASRSSPRAGIGSGRDRRDDAPRSGHGLRGRGRCGRDRRRSQRAWSPRTRWPMPAGTWCSSNSPTEPAAPSAATRSPRPGS